MINTFIQNLKGRVEGGVIPKGPTIAATLQVKNPRIETMDLNTVSSPPRFKGVFAVDVENTGILGTPAASVGDVDISVVKDGTLLKLIESRKAKPIGIINPQQTKTIKLEFDVTDEFVSSISSRACDDNKLNLDMNISVYELILGVQYETEKVVPIKRPNCSTISLDIEGKKEVQSSVSNTWKATGNIKDATKIRWDMGDGTVKTGTEVTHSYDRGSYTITATALRNGNEVVSEEFEVTSLLFIL